MQDCQVWYWILIELKETVGPWWIYALSVFLVADKISEFFDSIFIKGSEAFNYFQTWNQVNQCIKKAQNVSFHFSISERQTKVDWILLSLCLTFLTENRTDTL